ncbi:MAG TPA: class I SAM-dependent methyltransferase [Egibacteraceae bacterium]|jgi:SAM-dependent methyltransferase|nr:class I SAM-dependent methyltransferase [Egibacteraceae bacterium]
MVLHEEEAGSRAPEGGDLGRMYRRRFSDPEARAQMWQVLYEDFFSRFVPADADFLEIGAGYCEFTNVVRARRKIAVDLNADCRQHAAGDVEVICTPSDDLGTVASASVDVVFASNFFEHITREQIVGTLREVRRVLRPTGRLLILQPNIRFCARDYWMFFDHITPLDDRSLTEALETNGFAVREVIVRFLPYTTQGRLPASARLLRVYLRVPLLWRVFGQQSFIDAVPSPR